MLLSDITWPLYIILSLVICIFDKFTLILGRTGTWLLVLGGVAYTIGAILYGIGAKKKYYHTVFHVFVDIGSLLHFLCILLYVM